MTFQNSSRVYAAVSSLLWPAIFCAGLTGAYFAFQSHMQLLWFNVVYLSIVATIALFERLMPYEETWLERDGETFNNVAHTLLSKGSVQIAAAIGTSFPMAVATVAQPFLSHQAHIWPEQWPMALQVVLGLVIAEFGLYVAHRLAHEYLSLWRFHALHHSVERLWVINTGRFHIIDSLFKIALGQIPLYLLGRAAAGLPVDRRGDGLHRPPLPIATSTYAPARSTGSSRRRACTAGITRSCLPRASTNYGENLVIWDQIAWDLLQPAPPFLHRHRYQR